MAKEFAHETDASRYTLRENAEILAVVDYRVNGEQISFHHTYTNPAHRGKGLAGEIVEFAVNDVESNTKSKIVPMCWYVEKWFGEHPDRAGLLAPSTQG